jgi:hypothetical protein
MNFGLIWLRFLCSLSLVVWLKASSMFKLVTPSILSDHGHVIISYDPEEHEPLYPLAWFDLDAREVSRNKSKGQLISTSIRGGSMLLPIFFHIFHLLWKI